MWHRKAVQAFAVAALSAAAFAAGTAVAETFWWDSDSQQMVEGKSLEEARKNAQAQAKADFGVTDDEWSVLQPKINKVRQLARHEPEAVRKAHAALGEALDNKDANTQDIARKLAAVRKACEQWKADLKKARAELRELLNARQEAMLLLDHTLD